MWGARQPQGPSSWQAAAASFHAHLLLGRLGFALGVQSGLFSDLGFALVSPQHAHRVSTGRVAVSAACARTGGRATLPRGTAPVPRAGRGWPASWVRTQPAAPRDGCHHQPDPLGLALKGQRAQGDSSALCSLPACAEGRHGAGCGQRCTCQHGGLCDHRGHCLCPAGWTGTACESREWGLQGERRGAAVRGWELGGCKG